MTVITQDQYKIIYADGFGWRKDIMDAAIQNSIGTTQAAKILKRDPSTVAKMIREGELPAVKVGKRWKLQKADVLKLAETIKPADEASRGNLINQKPTVWKPALTRESLRRKAEANNRRIMMERAAARAKASELEEMPSIDMYKYLEGIA